MVQRCRPTGIAAERTRARVLTDARPISFPGPAIPERGSTGAAISRIFRAQIHNGLWIGREASMRGTFALVLIAGVAAALGLSMAMGRHAESAAPTGATADP